MSFTVKANGLHGSQLIHRRKSPEAALKKARELLKTCYEVHTHDPGGARLRFVGIRRHSTHASSLGGCS
jgi:hypothetical protein